LLAREPLFGPAVSLKMEPDKDLVSSTVLLPLQPAAELIFTSPLDEF
jgi:hypothetical protein